MHKNDLLALTRRHFFSRCAVGLGQIGLASLLTDGKLLAAEPAIRVAHFPAKVKSIIYLFMAGGPSQFELFDPKPKLQQLDGQPLPPSMLEGKRFAFMDATRANPTLYAPRRKFQRYGKCGKWVSECLPHTAKVVDDLA